MCVCVCVWGGTGSDGLKTCEETVTKARSEAFEATLKWQTKEEESVERPMKKTRGE